MKLASVSGLSGLSASCRPKYHTRLSRAPPDDARARADCLLAHLSKDKQTTVRVKKAARATFVRTTFQDNLAITGDEKKVPVGPAVGLENDKKNASIPASAAWFHDCVFVNHTSTHKEGEQFNVAMHEVSIEDAKAEVYTNAPDEPLLFDREKNEIAHPVLVGPGETLGGVFGPVRFLTEDDEWFATVAGVRRH